VVSALDKGGAERVTRLYRHIVPTKIKRPVPILAIRKVFATRHARSGLPNRMAVLFPTTPFFELLIPLPLALLD
jgi:hypothetical protein